MPRVTLADVSRHAGVSRSTASLVLNDSPTIPLSTKTRVRQAMAELGYVYNRQAATLRNQKSMAIGLAVTEVSNPYFAELAMALDDAAYANGYTVVVGYSRDDTERQDHLISTLLERGVDGLILLPAALSEATSIDRLLAGSRTPLVLLARHFNLAHDYVGADNRTGGQLLGRHIQSIGARTVALVGGPEYTSARVERTEGMKSVFDSAGIRLEPSTVLASETTPAGGAKATAELLDSGILPDVIVAYSDVIAGGIYAELHARGLEPGRDIAVAGFDDIPGSAQMIPPLTTVATFPNKIGTACAEMIFSRIADPEPDNGHEHVLIEPRLRIRASTASWRPRTPS
ncbi:LacI family DNA-binding transcriptional regulator [Arthrobacter mobilis]|uniref:LacI family transcriptional regulator n=1 Tax=Arthrobacter mobilis TaxID=2724944 RepID=A0A7X6HH43_9MICC|nr:LacI family DNA-binding transcriptional regulator [Arthrobacter mobilis]NKX55547.1 LacI family transcriptional regulator [Arthrobacter mobilis]